MEPTHSRPGQLNSFDLIYLFDNKKAMSHEHTDYGRFEEKNSQKPHHTCANFGLASRVI
jgi:hypothetical protein